MSNATIEDRIAAALRAQAELIDTSDLRAATPPRTSDIRTPSHWPWVAPVLAAAVVAALAIGTTAVVNNARSPGTVRPAGPTPTAPTSIAPTSKAPTSTAATSTAPTSATQQASPGPKPNGFTLNYQPLWPFASYTEAEQWRKTAAGSQPWHADPGQTALSFTTGYLGFSEITRITSTVLDSSGAHIGVGYLNPNAVPVTAATLHLVRFGSAADSPWEVVGTDDRTFSLELPAYGSKVSSPMTVGGHITGVDESILISVRQLGRQTPVGQYCCLPAGGENSSWSKGITFTGKGTLTIVASTGGHLQQVERFAIQGVYVP